MNQNRPDIPIQPIEQPVLCNSNIASSEMLSSQIKFQSKLPSAIRENRP